jgi:hypothetical protein
MKFLSLVSASSAILALTTAGALSFSAVALEGCGGGQGAKAANIPAGEMPSGETWTGVYFHPVYGRLHMVEQDTNVVGKWKRADSSAWGELSGTKVGNVLHFTWKEHKYGLVGPAAEAHGKGVFVYKMGSEKIAELDGQFGLNDDETGSDWHNVKQVRETPDLGSISGDLGGTAPAGAGKWDDK